MNWGRFFKWVVYIVPLVVFALLLNVGTPLKRPMSEGDDLIGPVHVAESAVLAEDWGTAAAAWEKAHGALDIVSRRIELAAERRELEEFYTELARLRGNIQAHERAAALEHISVLKTLYDELGR